MVLSGTRWGRYASAFSLLPESHKPACDPCSHRGDRSPTEDDIFTKTLLFIALLSAAPLAGAASTTELARETGLSERNVRMLLGARTPYAEYRINYDRKLRQFKRALGESDYRKLMNGDSIVLERKSSGEEQAIASVDATRP